MQQTSPASTQANTSAATQQPPSETTPEIHNPIDPAQVSTAMLYQENKPPTSQQRALLSQIPHTQGSLVCPSNLAAISSVETSQDAPRTAPMRPMDVAREWFLDYVSPQSIKFYNKSIEHLPVEKFNGNMPHTRRAIHK
jgi:hypothetical protein